MAANRAMADEAVVGLVVEVVVEAVAIVVIEGVVEVAVEVAVEAVGVILSHLGRCAVAFDAEVMVADGDRSGCTVDFGA